MDVGVRSRRRVRTAVWGGARRRGGWRPNGVPRDEESHSRGGFDKACWFPESCLRAQTQHQKINSKQRGDCVKLFEDDHPPTVAQAFRVARIALTPHDSLASVAAVIAEHEGALEAAMKANSDANDAVLAQAARVRYADAQLGRTVIEIAREARHDYGGQALTNIRRFVRCFRRPRASGWTA